MRTEDESGRSQRAIQSIEVGGQLLLALAANPEAMSLKDLALQAGLPASRAHPYLVSYGRLGLVQQDPASGRYALGPAALRLGLTALKQSDPIRASEPLAQALAAQTGQAVALSTWGNFGPTVVRLIEARQPLHVAMRVGTVMALFGTATGRALAAVLRPEHVADAQARVALGAEASPASPGALEAELESARAEFARHGCTRAVGRPIPGVNAFSAPIFDHEGHPVLALTLLGHQDHVPAQWSSTLAASVKQAAAEASARLGWVGSEPSGVRRQVFD